MTHVIEYWIISYESSDSQLEGPEEVQPFAPLIESEPLGLLWSVSEIEDFRNHEKIHKPFYMNSFHKHKNFYLARDFLINSFQFIDMVPEILNFTNRPE